MKTYIIFAFLLVSIIISSFKPVHKSVIQALTKKWETDSILKMPESVIYDANSNFLYVSNINGDAGEIDGNGFISRVSLYGKIETLEWATGLDAPKGMAILKGKLYVADINKVAVIDIASGKVDKKISIPGSEFLNDITVDKLGNIYISDSNIKKVYLLKNGVISLWYDGTKTLKSPNGLLATDNGLKLIDMESGNFYSIGYTDKKLTRIAQNVLSGDGIVEIGKEEFLISGWQGEVYNVMGENVIMVLDTKDHKRNAADIWYLPSERLLLIPTFFGNSIAAYELN